MIDEDCCRELIQSDIGLILTEDYIVNMGGGNVDLHATTLLDLLVHRALTGSQPAEGSTGVSGAMYSLATGSVIAWNLKE